MISAETTTTPQRRTGAVLRLDDGLLIGRGRLRACYAHPGDPGLVVKVPLRNRPRGERGNRREMRCSRELRRNHPGFRDIAHCHELVATSLGPGLVCDCIRDEDGRISRAIWDIVVYQPDCNVRYVQRVVETFCDRLIAERIFSVDVNLKNIVLQLHANGTYAPFAVDLKGPDEIEAVLDPLRRFEFFGRRRLIKRKALLLARIAACRRQRESLQRLERNRR